LARAAYALAPHEALSETLLLDAAVLSFLLLPALPFRPWGRGMFFALLFCALAFVPMMLLHNAGWVQHTSLVLPFPQFFVAAGLVGVKERVLGWARAFSQLAARRGYEGETLEIVRDLRGRPIYEIVALRPAAGTEPRP